MTKYKECVSHYKIAKIYNLISIVGLAFILTKSMYLRKDIKGITNAYIDNLLNKHIISSSSLKILIPNKYDCIYYFNIKKTK